MAYMIVEGRGQGGYGIVNKVVDKNGEEYAKKELNLPAFPPAAHDGLKKRFEREIKYQEQLDHPNIVKILDHDLSADPPWFVMPLAEGSLADDIELDRTLRGDPQNLFLISCPGLKPCIKEASFTET